MQMREVERERERVREAIKKNKGSGRGSCEVNPSRQDAT
jgi:hypothetical protein